MMLLRISIDIVILFVPDMHCCGVSEVAYITIFLLLKLKNAFLNLYAKHFRLLKNTFINDVYEFCA